MSEIAKRLTDIRQRMALACETHQRSAQSVQLIAVSKYQPVEAIQQALDHGQLHFGENYAQELLQKDQALNHADIQWHFIGHLQSNKASDIAPIASWVHSVDRLKLAKKLNQNRPKNMTPLNICLQVNLHQEQQKAGIEVGQLSALIEQIIPLDRLCLRGLMIIPEAGLSPEQTQQSFAQLRAHLCQLQHQFPQLKLDTLSMGMSQDWPLAIAEGATFIRIGTAVFGARPTP